MNIFFYGDSHTLGAEIDDHTIMHKSFDEVNFQKKSLRKNAGWTQGMIAWNTQIASKLNKQLWKIANRVSPHSFPKVVSRELRRTVKVRAQTAMSMDFMCLQLFTDLQSGELTKDDIIIVSLPRPTRSYSLDREHGRYDVKYLNLVGSMNAEMRDHMIEAGVPEYLLVDTFLNDHRQVAEYYKNLKSILDWASLNELSLYFIHTIDPEYVRVDAENPPELLGVKTHCVTASDWEYREFCLSVYEEMSQRLLIPENMYELAEPSQLCGFNHPNAEVHQRYGKLIAQKITDTLL